MNKEENAVKALEYLRTWLTATRDSVGKYYPEYEYKTEVLNRVDEAFEIYDNGKLSSLSTNLYTATFQKDYI